MTTTSTRGDAADIAFCDTYVEAAYLGPNSATDYMETMAAEYHRQANHAVTNDAKVMLARIAAAYADCLRVLDIAADQASDAAKRVQS